MATAKTMMVIDGRLIRAGEEIPDLGSWAAVRVDGNVRSYEGLSADIKKLPRYVPSGSTALCVDTGDTYKYNKSSGIWYKTKIQPGDCGCGDGGDTPDYTKIKNKPKINGVELDGDIALEDLGLGNFTAGGVTFSVDEENECLQIEY